ncbi:MAG TPA: retropepsin-like aspartic protease, partial [Chryseobacterium sp.]
MSLDEDIQQQIINCLATSSSESSSEDGLAEVYSESDNDSDNGQCQTCTINNCKTSAEADYWKAIVEMNGLDVGSPSINVLTDTQKSLLDLAENIKDPEIKLKFLEICYKNQKTEDNLPIDQYSMRKVMKRIKNVSTADKPTTTLDLKNEINILKSEIKQLQNTNTIIFHDLKSIKQQLNNKQDNHVESSKTESTDKPESSEQYLMLMNQVVFQKWYIRITLVIKPDFIIKDAIALVDSGADMNCIQEGLIPTKYFQKTTQSLTSASGKTMNIKYKIPEALICNQGLCLPTSFVLICNMNQSIILGTPFLCLLMPISKIDTLGIHTTLNNRHIVFEFITEPYTKELNQVKHMIYSKEKQINFIQKEIKFLSTEQRI